jgi:hypothetical protein
VALKSLEAAKTTSPLVQQCQKVLNNMSSQQPVGLFWAPPTHFRVHGNEIADKFPRQGTVHRFAGPELALGVPKAAYKKKGKILDGNEAYGNVMGSYQYLGDTLQN